ncbi:cell division protein ZipA [Phytohalomonas tamaricis]|uniref:cell division protein ZipA n=1 Tax=Phytohalomonas tamaricis TaxID=2081032 RepID=UPI000D0B8B67|nr:cell division protein ZipA [Phytohalomonas tamaricis]
MELREWLIILGLVLVAIIVVDGVRRLQRQRRVPRLDLGDEAQNPRDPEDVKREEALSWELPNGGARVVDAESVTDPRSTRQPASHDEDDYDDEHEPDEEDSPPGRFAGLASGKIFRRPLDEMNKRRAARISASEQREAQRQVERQRQAEAEQRHAEELTAAKAKEARRTENEQLAARSRYVEPDNYDDVHDDRYSDQERFDGYADDADDSAYEEIAAQHPAVELAKRHQVGAERARNTLADADEIIVISVMAHDDEGFSGLALLKLMLACGLRYSEMGVFHRFESESDNSPLQFSMVNVIKPGTFALDAIDEDFYTPGVTFLMPLPGAEDTRAAFEAMFETAMVLVRNLGGELKDENRSVMTAQTVEFARQRVHEFERRWRLHRHHAN